MIGWLVTGKRPRAIDLSKICSEKIKLLNMMYFALIGRFPIRGYIDKSFYLFLKMYKSLKTIPVTTVQLSKFVWR
jgi:hypothetical protein